MVAGEPVQGLQRAADLVLTLTFGERHQSSAYRHFRGLTAALWRRMCRPHRPESGVLVIRPSFAAEYLSATERKA